MSSVQQSVKQSVKRGDDGGLVRNKQRSSHVLMNPQRLVDSAWERCADAR